jgi:poly(A) polymerase
LSGVTIADKAAWLGDPALQKLLAVLSTSDETARIAGGAVRNAILEKPVADIDVATTNLPAQVIERAEAAGFRAVPTGIEHGTVTVIADGRPFEVTTLRADVETDGRHAKVVFGRDWRADAERRDFTINALYAGADGTVVDLVGGLADLQARTVRFIGDAEMRIREDYLRILRFFRFFAWYGAGRPDADGLKACARLKGGLERLSAERVWAELRKLLSAADPSRALLWMRQASVLTTILPESEKWGIDAIHGLVAAERELHWPADPLLRLAAIVPPDVRRIEAMAARLRMSTAEAERLSQWASATPLAADATELLARQKLYRHYGTGLSDRLKLVLAGARSRAVNDNAALIEAAGFARLLKVAEAWRRPALPVTGKDLIELGMQEGPLLGERLKSLESAWLDSGFQLGRDALLERAAKMDR